MKPSRVIAGFILILLEVLVLYRGNLRAGFLWDDTSLILKDPKVHENRSIPQIFSSPFGPIGQGRQSAYYRPVTSITYLMNYDLSGRAPFSYHLFNIVMHGLVSFEVFILIWFLLDAYWIAMVSALLFAAHPARAPSVAWIAGRTDILCSFFLLPALIFYIRRKRGCSPAVSLVLSCIAFLLALGSKELAFVFPATILLVDLHESRGKNRDLRAVIGWRDFSIYTLILAAFVVVHRVVIGRVGAGLGSIRVADWLVNVPVNLAQYLRISLLPVHLSGFYFLKGVSFSGSVVIDVAFLFLLFFLRKERTVLFGGLWFIIFLLPVLGFMPINSLYASADHMSYLPSVGLFIVGASIARSTLKNASAVSPGMLAAVAVSGVLVLYAAGTMQRIPNFDNEVSFFGTLSRAYPEDGYFYGMLGQALIDRNDLTGAEKSLKKGVSIDPGNWRLWFDMSELALKKNDYRKAGEYLKRASRLDGAESPVFNNLGNLYFISKDYSAAEDAYRKALKRNPYYYDAMYNLARAYLLTGNPAGAAKVSERFIRLAPEGYRAQKNDLRTRFGLSKGPPG